MGVAPSVLWSWDVNDVDLLLALDEIESEPRNAYGIRMVDATDPANQFKFQASKNPTTDWAEKTVADIRDAYYKKWPDASRNGHLWSVTLPTD